MTKLDPKNLLAAVEEPAVEGSAAEPARATPANATAAEPTAKMPSSKKLSTATRSVGQSPAKGAGKKASTQKPAAKKPRTMSEAVREYGSAARKRTRPYFKAAGVKYPPNSLTLVGLKEEKLLVVLAPDQEGVLHKVISYPILAASGEPGPKLAQGDFQVPEGFYKIEAFNPNSAYHLSLRVSYPNAEDLARARKEKRTNLGGDIMIHGNAVSIGCLAIGDEPIEEVFILVNDVGRENVNVLLAPSDLTSKPSGVDFKLQPKWLPALYKRLKKSLEELPPLLDE
jgi:murein L,D-transpeptidase YafK